MHIQLVSHKHRQLSRGVAVCCKQHEMVRNGRSLCVRMCMRSGQDIVQQFGATGMLNVAPVSSDKRAKDDATQQPDCCRNIRAMQWTAWHVHAHVHFDS